MKRVFIIGPAYPLRGGLATFNQRLSQEFEHDGYESTIISFSLQYPKLLFPGKTQFSSDPEPENLAILSLINSINPVNWIRVGRKLKNWKPDIIVVRYWIPLMAPALGTILRMVRKNKYTKIICIADNVQPHEKRPGDKVFTRYFLKACDGFITMSEKVLKDLRSFEPLKPAKLIQHPLYDNFGNAVDKQTARSYLQLPPSDKLILFFGFIRVYKGLDLLIRAMALDAVASQNIKLVIAGEFYEDETAYLDLIKELNLNDRIFLRTNFIADNEVKYYLCAADCVVQPYKNATQSGVTPLAYFFEKPMIVTNVGGLPSLVPHEKAGLVCSPDPASIANAIMYFYQLGENYFIPHLRKEKQKYAWSNITSAIKELAGINLITDSNSI